MGLFLRQDGGRSELQTKIAADLKERLKERAAEPQEEYEPAMLEDQHETRSPGLVIGLLLLAAFGALIWWVLHIVGII